MTSSIDPNNINPNVPVSDQDNSSQNLRDNFSNIQGNFAKAADEITGLQDKLVGLTGPVYTPVPIPLGTGPSAIIATQFATSNDTYTLTFPGTGAIKIPAGTTLQRPTGAAAGMVRYNTTFN